jgi:hypothetical protein
LRLAPKANLPDSAEPWGRWYDDERRSIRNSLELENAKIDGSGAQFRSKADNLAATIAQFSSRRMVALDLPDFDGTASGSIGWVAYGRTISFALQSRVTEKAKIDLAFDVPRIPVGVISNGPNNIQLIVNGVPTGGIMRLRRLNGPADMPLASSRLSFRVPIAVIPGAVNQVRIELGSYFETSASWSFAVDAKNVTMSITLEEAR